MADVTFRIDSNLPWPRWIRKSALNTMPMKERASTRGRRLAWIFASHRRFRKFPAARIGRCGYGEPRTPPCPIPASSEYRSNMDGTLRSSSTSDQGLNPAFRRQVRREEGWEETRIDPMHHNEHEAASNLNVLDVDKRRDGILRRPSRSTEPGSTKKPQARG